MRPCHAHVSHGVLTHILQHSAVTDVSLITQPLFSVISQLASLLNALGTLTVDLPAVFKAKGVDDNVRTMIVFVHSATVFSF